MNKKLEWIKEHKKEILIGSLATVGTGVLAYLGIKKIANLNPTIDSLESIMSIGEKGQILDGVESLSDSILDISLDSGITVTEAWKEIDKDGTEFVSLILNDFKPADIGKLGEDLVKNVPGITEETILTCMMGSTQSE